MRRAAAIGDKPGTGGRELGDVVFATAAPDGTFVAANGAETTGNLGKTKLAMPGTVGANDNEASASAGYPLVVNKELYYFRASDGTIQKKTTATGALTQVWATPAGYAANDMTSGFWYANGKFWRCYTAGTFKLEYATVTGGAWTAATSAPPAGGGPHHLFWSAYANRFYFCVQGDKPYQSTDGGATWSAVPNQASMTNGVNVGFDIGNRVVFFGQSGAIYHSTDAGVSFASVAGGHIAVNHAWNVVWNSFDSKFYATASANYQIYSHDAPWLGTAWTLESSNTPAGSNTQDMGFYCDGEGRVYATGRVGAYVKVNGNWSAAGATPGSTTNWSPAALIDFDGYMHVYARNVYRPLIYADGRTRYKVPTIGAINGLNAYVKNK